jgi:hypothetical protein
MFGAFEDSGLVELHWKHWKHLKPRQAFEFGVKVEVG